MEMHPYDPIDVLRSHSLSALVRDEIERHITGGALGPGDKLIEADWAARLKVSRGPVREAFRALEQAGLLRTEKHRGVFVRTITLAEVDEIYAVRAVLEEAACRMLAQRIDADQIARLRECLDAMSGALAAGDHDAYARQNVVFHDAIVASAGNGTLHGTYRRLVGELSLFRRAALAVHADAMKQSLAEHRAIVTALASYDPDDAAALMRIHVTGGRRRAHAACESSVQLPLPAPARRPTR